MHERLWTLEDEIAAVQTVTYNAQQICDQLAEFTRAFPTLTDGERRLVVDSPPSLRPMRRDPKASPAGHRGRVLIWPGSLTSPLGSSIDSPRLGPIGNMNPFDSV